jgi:hypothetical protein
MRRAETTPRPCLECGEQFVPRSSTHSFCSSRCKTSHNALEGGQQAQWQRELAEIEERTRVVLEELGVERWEDLDLDEVEARGGCPFSALDLFTVCGWPPLVRSRIRPRGAPRTE